MKAKIDVKQKDDVESANPGDVLFLLLKCFVIILSEDLILFWDCILVTHFTFRHFGYQIQALELTENT